MLREREITCAEAIREAMDQAMAADDRVFIIGEGTPDPKGIFGTTLGLKEKYGEKRVMDMPVSENAVTGMCIGAALKGLRPIMTHQRVDFSLYALEQIINNAAKWHFMFGGVSSVPLVIRMIIGRGWGQGAQHSQNLQALFAHIPGLKVVMPATAYDAKGLLLASIEDNNPVIFLEHRWIHGLSGRVPEGRYQVPLGKAKVVNEGGDVTIVASSYMTVEALRAARILKDQGIGVDLIDLRTIKPLDDEMIFSSVKKTGRLVVVDSSWQTGGAAGEIIARVTEKMFASLKRVPQRIALLDMPTPSSPALTKEYYPTYRTIVEAVSGRRWQNAEAKNAVPHDVPDKSFTGPF
ncbi:MAG: alpha-ketoacid dehydrogenase subunit beta [bacterium]